MLILLTPSVLKYMMFDYLFYLQNWCNYAKKLQVTLKVPLIINKSQQNK